ncbi:MAG: alkaline phosphatase family protein [Pirellulaceae bacterium]
MRLIYLYSILVFVILPSSIGVMAQEAVAERLLLVTLDGLRWQELFTGADARLMTKDGGNVNDEDALRNRFFRDSPEERRIALMPFFWNSMAAQGQVFGDPDHDSSVTVTNGHFFSYPGYNEILSGIGDPAIDSNDKNPNPNVSVLEFLHNKSNFAGQVFAFGSWDVFPFILNEGRSGIPVNAGWEPLNEGHDSDSLERLDAIAKELPAVWPSVRYDIFTLEGALHCLRTQKPKILYVALGETDDWAHEGRYDLYLDSANRNDRYIQRLWQAAQAMPEFANKTALILTTDHGRGDGREGWKSHGVDYPGSDKMWIAVMGPGIKSLGVRNSVHVTQAQVAATVAKLLGHDFSVTNQNVAPPLPLAPVVVEDNQ